MNKRIGKAGIILAAVLATTIPGLSSATMPPIAGGSAEFSDIRDTLSLQAPNWKLYWAHRDGSHVAYYVGPDPVLGDEQPGGQDDFTRMALTLWQDAAECWASLPPSDEEGTCIITLTSAAKAMTTAGRTVEIVRLEAFYGTAQTDILEALRAEPFRDMGDRQFLSWWFSEFPSFGYTPDSPGCPDDNLSEEAAAWHTDYVRKMVMESLAERSGEDGGVGTDGLRPVSGDGE